MRHLKKKLKFSRPAKEARRALRNLIANLILYERIETTEAKAKKARQFLDRLINVALPRTRDFRGVPDKLDGRGNYTLGIREQLLFPEVDYDSIDKIRGMEISINTTAETDGEARRLLELLGMPFRR